MTTNFDQEGLDVKIGDEEEEANQNEEVITDAQQLKQEKPDKDGKKQKQPKVGLEQSSNAKQALELSRFQEIDLQRMVNFLKIEETKHSRARAEYQDQLARKRQEDKMAMKMKLQAENIRFAEEEKRKTIEHELQMRHKLDLERIEAEVHLQEETLRKQEESVKKQEDIRKANIEHELQMRHKLDLERIEAEVRAKSSNNYYDDSVYDRAPSPPPPTSESIDKWMFYAFDQLVGKSTVVCVNPRYFVTFRHGTHKELHVESAMKIYHAKSEPNEGNAIDVNVVDINEQFDFILLRSKKEIVDKAPKLVAAENSENFLLAGFGDNITSEQQQLSYLGGIVYSNRGFRFYSSTTPQIAMGPFILGTAKSSKGDSGGGCWGPKGLIGINSGVTRMPETYHSHAISEAATFSPKNIITPSVQIKEALTMQLIIEELQETEPPKKQKKMIAEIGGIVGPLFAEKS